jgi:bis(5'-nucleosyl)-tetraphosphatase (symmetrical)
MWASVAIIGDIHGCVDELRELLCLLCDVPTIVTTGDLVDRGPDPIGVIKLLRESQIASVCGNHDEKLIRWLRHEEKRRTTGKPNPMQSVSPAEAETYRQLDKSDIAYVLSMPDYLRIADTLVVHAGFMPGVAIEKQKPGDMLRIRWIDNATGKMAVLTDDLSQPLNTTYWMELWRGPNVVYGHSVHSLTDIRIDRTPHGWCAGIDTGCVFGGRLSALLIPTMEIVQVQARKAYCCRSSYHP